MIILLAACVPLALYYNCSILKLHVSHSMPLFPPGMSCGFGHPSGSALGGDSPFFSSTSGYVIPACLDWKRYLRPGETEIFSSSGLTAYISTR